MVFLFEAGSRRGVSSRGKVSDCHLIFEAQIKEDQGRAIVKCVLVDTNLICDFTREGVNIQ